MKINDKFVDINDVEVKIGDVIIIPKYSNLSKHVVLGFTKSSMIVSSYMKSRFYSSLNETCWYTVINNNLLQHNARQYYHGYSFIIIDRNFNIPENLIKFVKSY